MTPDPNTLSFITLAAEYCKTVTDSSTLTREEFVGTMLRLLPSLYTAIAAHTPSTEPDMDVIGAYVDEDHYNQARQAIAALMGEDDTYLETVMEEMKYSDTPIAASVSEGLADIYQDMYNFSVTIRESEGTLTPQAMDQMHENFTLYWSRTLCSVMRPLNALRYPL